MNIYLVTALTLFGCCFYCFKIYNSKFYRTEYKKSNNFIELWKAWSKKNKNRSILLTHYLLSLKIKLNYEKNQNKLKIKLINLEIDELIATNTDKKYKKVESVYFEFYLFKSKE